MHQEVKKFHKQEPWLCRLPSDKGDLPTHIKSAPPQKASGNSALKSMSPTPLRNTVLDASILCTFDTEPIQTPLHCHSQYLAPSQAWIHMQTDSSVSSTLSSTMASFLEVEPSSSAWYLWSTKPRLQEPWCSRNETAALLPCKWNLIAPAPSLVRTHSHFWHIRPHSIRKEIGPLPPWSCPLVTSPCSAAACYLPQNCWFLFGLLSLRC